MQEDSASLTTTVEFIDENGGGPCKHRFKKGLNTKGIAAKRAHCLLHNEANYPRLTPGRMRIALARFKAGDMNLPRDLAAMRGCASSLSLNVGYTGTAYQFRISQTKGLVSYKLCAGG